MSTCRHNRGEIDFTSYASTFSMCLQKYWAISANKRQIHTRIVKMEITKSTWKLILQESIEAIRTEIDKDMPVSGIQLLLAMPEKGAISFREIERITRLPHSTTSRGLALLAGVSKVRITSFTPLVVFSDDLADRRVRYATLTAEGVAKMDKVYGNVYTSLARLKQLNSNNT